MRRNERNAGEKENETDDGKAERTLRPWAVWQYRTIQPAKFQTPRKSPKITGRISVLLGALRLPQTEVPNTGESRETKTLCRSLQGSKPPKQHFSFRDDKRNVV
jgi:hypothetical protein